MVLEFTSYYMVRYGSSIRFIIIEGISVMVEGLWVSVLILGSHRWHYRTRSQKGLLGDLTSVPVACLFGVDECGWVATYGILSFPICIYFFSLSDVSYPNFPPLTYIDYYPFFYIDTAIMKAQVTPNNQKALSVLWGPLDETVVTGHEDGAIIKWDLRTSKKVSCT